MHEQSETEGGGLDALWRNVYGRRTPQAGKTLPPKLLMERDAYKTKQEAEFAAKWRSLLTAEQSNEPRPLGLLDLLMRLR